MLRKVTTKEIYATGTSCTEKVR